MFPNNEQISRGRIGVIVGEARSLRLLLLGGRGAGGRGGVGSASLLQPKPESGSAVAMELPLAAVLMALAASAAAAPEWLQVWDAARLTAANLTALGVSSDCALHVELYLQGLSHDDPWALHSKRISLLGSVVVFRLNCPTLFALRSPPYNQAFQKNHITRKYNFLRRLPFVLPRQSHIQRRIKL